MPKPGRVCPHHGVLRSWEDNQENLYTVVYSDLQKLLLDKKSKMQKITYIVVPFV